MKFYICHTYSAISQLFFDFFLPAYIKPSFSYNILNLFLCKLQSNLSELIPFFNDKFWAKLPSFYVGEKFIRIIPFKDHINIEAEAIMEHKQQLEQFKITPKGMLQIYLNQGIPSNVLTTIFNETLIG